MSILEAVILGIVQGITEFLPVSSSGHLALLQFFFGLEEGARLFTIVVHVGTLVPVLWVYRREVLGLARQPFQRYTYMLVLGTLPTVVAALMLGDALDDVIFGNITLLPYAFLFTALILFLSERMGKDGRAELRYGNSLAIGLMQAVAIIPGISRSGSTIFAGLACGLSREEAARYSFMLSIPAILGGLTLEVVGLMAETDAYVPVPFLQLAFGFVAAMLTGYLAINMLLAMIRKRNLKIFSAYLVVLATALLILT